VNGTAQIKVKSQPKSMSAPSRQVQNHQTAFVKGAIVQPIKPAIAAKSKITDQKSIRQLP